VIPFCFLDAFLPTAQIELPEYSTEEIMRKRVLTACNFGIGGFLIA
jgi:hypothetical protein